MCVRTYPRDGPACGQRFPAAADVGPSSRVPLRDTKPAMIIPYLPTERAGPYRLAGFFGASDLLDDATLPLYLRATRMNVLSLLGSCTLNLPSFFSLALIRA